MFDFDDEALDELDARPEQEPVLVCFYSGGFFHADGQKLLSDVLSSAARVGLGDSLVLGFPDHYGIEGEGIEWWPKYVDLLVEQIDSEEAYRGRPLLLFGHSRGACPAMSVATRLGSRVLKVYITGCGPIEMGKPTAWELLSTAFKKGGDKELLAWFSSLQPGNVILKRASDLPEVEIPNALAQSKWLASTVKLMRLQYRDATFPLMTGDDADIQVISAPLMVGVPLQDAGCTEEICKPWEFSSHGGCEFVVANQGHMDCIVKDGEILAAFIKDMAKFVPAMA